MKKPTIAQLESALTTARNEISDLREYKQQHQPLQDQLRELKNEKNSLEHSLQESRAQTNLVIFRLELRMDFIAKLREQHAYFCNAIAVGAPDDVIEQHRQRCFDYMADLTLLDIQEPDVDQIKRELETRIRDLGGSFDEWTMRKPMANAEAQPKKPYGL